MKIASWNVNSIRMRLERVVAWLGQHAPDVLCMQETKVEDDKFPVDAFESAGYRVAFAGQKSYSGVAIAAREPIAGVARGWADDARVIAGTVRGVRIASVYVPNGKHVEHEDFAAKLAWLGRLRRWLDDTAQPAQPFALCGDFNVARDDRDVHDPAAWEGQNMCSAPERAALENVLAWGLRDAFRELHPEPGFYSWWDYRMLGFPKNRGLRIDYAFVTQPLRERLVAASIDRNARKGSKPSDHAPVVIELRA
jgi:exodeoxyribonuclease-3